MPSDAPPAVPKAKSSRRLLGLICAGVAVAMVGVAYAAVPLYRVFCEATGFDGTVRRGQASLGEGESARTVTVRFDTNVRNLPWAFKPEVATQTVRLGAPGMAWFKVRNDSDAPITGRAVYNVVPESAGAYFVKTECFCFKDQTIPAHTEMRFPVIYYVQPKFGEDRETSIFQEITLSYTYFPSASAPQGAAPAPTAAFAPAQSLGGSGTRGL